MRSVYDDDDYWWYQKEAAEEEFIEESLKGISHWSVQMYLGTYGDAVDVRVQGCLKEAEELLSLGRSGPALCSAAIAIELMVRYLLLRPLIQGAFLSDEWAGLLTRHITSGRSADDRGLLPAILRQWGIDITTIHTDSGIRLWEHFLRKVVPARNNFLHRADPVEIEAAETAIQCARLFRKDIVGSLASKFGFTLETTGKWCEIRWEGPLGTKGSSSFDPEDPFAATGEGS